MNLTSIPSIGVHRDTATSTDPTGLEGAAPLNGQTGLFIFSRSPIQVWQRSAAGTWSIAVTLTGAEGSRKHSINWGDLTRIYVKSTSGSDVTVRFVGQTTSAPVAQGAAVNTWSGLSDTPNAYAGHGGKYPKVKANESGIEFVESASGADASGNITIGSGTDAAGSTNALALKAGTAPTSTVADQAFVYSKLYAPEVIAYYPFNGNDGDTDLATPGYADNSGNGHSFTASVGVPSLSSTAHHGSTSLRLAGDRLYTDDHADYAFGTGDFTIMMWVKIWTMEEPIDILYRTLGASVGTSTLKIYAMPSTHAGGYSVKILDGTNTEVLRIDTTTAAFGLRQAFKHLAVIRESGVLKIYMDGIMVGSAPYTTDITETQHALGMGSGSQAFNGWVDDLVIANAALYTTNFTPPVPFSDSQAASLHVTDGAGNETKISPHNKAGEWEYVSRNKITGKSVRINMEKMIKKLEGFTGETFIEED